MKQRWIWSAVIVFLLGAGASFAQQTESGPIPATTRAQMSCTGFISGTPITPDLYVGGGARNQFLNTLYPYTVGDYVYLLHHRGGAQATVGQEYRLVRLATESGWHEFAHGFFSTSNTFTGVDFYPGQIESINSLGKPYEDVGRIKVIKVTKEGAVARVEFSCSVALKGDLAIPYSSRPIPTYTPTDHLNRFGPTTSSLTGGLTAARSDNMFLGDGGIGYISLGSSDGVKSGEKFRVIRMLSMDRLTTFIQPELPHETIGEVVVLWTQEKSSVVIVVNAKSEVEVGDKVELE